MDQVKMEWKGWQSEVDMWIEKSQPVYVPFRGFVLKYKDFELSLDRDGRVRLLAPSGEVMIYECSYKAHSKLQIKLNEIDLQEIAARRKTY